MFPEMKYIVVRARYRGADQEIVGQYGRGADSDLIQDFPILFPKALTHVEMSRFVDISEDFKQFCHDDVKVISAGFLRYDDMRGWVCFGESESLKNEGVEGYRSRGEKDADLLTTMHVMHGLGEAEDV